MRWAGNRLVPTGFLVCSQHLDQPHMQDRVLILRADPVPVRHPRPDIDGEPVPLSAPDVLTTDFGIPLTADTGELLTA